MKRKIGFGLNGFVALVMLWLGLPSANAATVIYEDVGFLSSSKAYQDPNSFTISAAGKYKAKLVDFTFPESFKSLELSLISGTPNPLNEVARLNAPGELIFDAAPGTYYAAVLGQVGPTIGLGLYGVQISQWAIDPLPTPLPPAIWLLGSAMASLVAFRRRGPAAA